jgi:di/tricarboxylate transporter
MDFSSLNPDQWVVIAVLILLIVFLYKGILNPTLSFFLAIVCLMVFGIISPKEILIGFSNEQIAVILMLILLGFAFEKSGLLDVLFRSFFQRVRHQRGFVGRMSFLVGSFSAFLNNTPLVAMMMPYAQSWAQKNNISPSKLMIPLSYAAIFGGCVTLIGTSTNLVVNGLWQDQVIFPNRPSLNIFDFFIVGFPLMLLGWAYLTFFSKNLLPNRKNVLQLFDANSREYLTEALIKPGSPIDGKTIEGAGLRNLKDIYLVEIIRPSGVLSPVAPAEILQPGDKLIFAGNTSGIRELINGDLGLSLPEHTAPNLKEDVEIKEIVISHNSGIINKNVRESDFRMKFNAAIIAIHRNGEKLKGKIGDVVLKPGDVLLILTGLGFEKRARETNDFYLISQLMEVHKFNATQNVILILGTLALIILSATGTVPLFNSLLVFIPVLVLSGILNLSEIKRKLDLNLALLITFALALGTAMTKTGTSDLFATQILLLFQDQNLFVLFLLIFFITNLFSSFLTNMTGVAIIFPIALSIAQNLGEDPIPFVLLVAFGAAANFLTPIGYQTNLMVFGPGGYKFRDYFKIGLPITLLYMLGASFILSRLY